MKEPHQLTASAWSWKAWLQDGAICAILILAAATLRIAFTSIPNFAPVAAAGLFAGIWVRHRMLALAVPCGAMIVSDWWLALGGYEWGLMILVYGGLAIPALLGLTLRRRALSSLGQVPAAFRWISQVGGATLAGSMVFFLVTNAGVWWLWYPRDLAGLQTCFVAAIPFFKYTVMGDLFFAGGLLAVHIAVATVVLSRSDSRVALASK